MSDARIIGRLVDNIYRLMLAAEKVLPPYSARVPVQERSDNLFFLTQEMKAVSLDLEREAELGLIPEPRDATIEGLRAQLKEQTASHGKLAERHDRVMDLVGRLLDSFPGEELDALPGASQLAVIVNNHRAASEE